VIKNMEDVKMKKFNALLIMALFIISLVPLVAAEDTTVDSQAVVNDISVVSNESGSEPQPMLTSANPEKTNKDSGIGKLVEKNAELRQKILDTRANLRDKIAQIRNSSAIKFENLREEQAQKLEKLNATDMKKLALLDRARIKKIAALDETQMRLELAKLKIVQVRKDLLFKNREIAKDKLDKAKDNFDKAEKNYNESKAKFEDEKALFEKYKNTNSTVALEHAKKFLNHAGDVVINLLEKIKSKVQSNDGLTDNESSTMIADIDARIAAVKAAQDAINASTTKEEVKAAAKTIIDEWSKTKGDIQEYVGRLVNAKVGEVIQRSEQLEKKLNDVLSEMKNKSISVDSINTKVDLFSMRIDEARNKFKTAQSLFDQVKAMKGENMTADTSQTIKTLSGQANSLAKEALSALQDAHSILMTIVKDVKQAGGQDINLESDNTNTTTVDVVQDTTAADTTEQETGETQEPADTGAQEDNQTTETNSTESVNETATA
jgi:hypothetical protein